MKKHKGCSIAGDCDACEANVKKFYEQLRASIAESGFAVVWNFSEVYTAGLTEMGLPEIVISGDLSSADFSRLVSDLVPKLVEHWDKYDDWRQHLLDGPCNLELTTPDGRLTLEKYKDKVQYVLINKGNLYRFIAHK